MWFHHRESDDRLKCLAVLCAHRISSVVQCRTMHTRCRTVHVFVITAMYAVGHDHHQTRCKTDSAAQMATKHNITGQLKKQLVGVERRSHWTCHH